MVSLEGQARVAREWSLNESDPVLIRAAMTLERLDAVVAGTAQLFRRAFHKYFSTKAVARKERLINQKTE
jgi:hypothetical protein